MKTIVSSLFLLISLSLFAKVELPVIFTDNMVLQQQTDAPVWGKASPGKTVEIVTSWDNQKYTTKAAADGSWKTSIKTGAAGGPYSITISDGKILELKNVMLGEVWICSGQSNMEMPLAGWGQVLKYKEEIAAANFPDIRFLHVDRATAMLPQASVKVSAGGWQVCSPATIAEFSSTAYFFGRNLHQNMNNIPIGLINTSWGGTIAEAWTSAQTLENMPAFRDAIEKVKATLVDESPNNPNRTTVLYNAMIHPLVPYAIQGAIWYQGESNVGRAEQYSELFPLMIRDWRSQWNRNFPFYFVQLANFQKLQTGPEESAWAELREAQLKTLNLENTGMAVIIDIGDAVDIHPKNKQDVGNRLALAARAKTYGQKIPYSGPIYQSHVIEGHKIRIRFSNTDGGLKAANNEPVKGFTIAGPDHKFYWADAKIEGNEVVVSSTNVPFPVAVRYAWANNPVCNLYNGAGLPASPFRTNF